MSVNPEVATHMHELVSKVIDSTADDNIEVALREQLPDEDDDLSVLDAMNAEFKAVDAKLDAATAELASLKRKYEPDTGIVLSKMLKLRDDHEMVFMRVTVRTGGHLPMVIALAPRSLCSL